MKIPKEGDDDLFPGSPACTKCGYRGSQVINGLCVECDIDNDEPCGCGDLDCPGPEGCINRG